MKAKYLSIAVAAVLATLSTLTSCNEDWSEEQYTHYLSFRAPLNSLGVTDLYVPYSRKDTLGNFTKGSGLSNYDLPVIISGSTTNSGDVTVRVAYDPDTLATLNYARFQSRKDLYYNDMSSYATFPESITIKGGENVGLLPIDFNFKDIDMAQKWVLPLTIVDEGSSLPSHPRKNYAKAMLRVYPFNDYSGNYSGSSMKIATSDAPDYATVKSTITGYVVNDSTIFFYAGDIDEDRTDRANYKVYCVFRPYSSDGDRGAAHFYAENDDMNFQGQDGTYIIQEQMDDTQPYLMHRYLTIRDIKYTFDDYTSVPDYRTNWLIQGTLILERQLNTQIPDEDQAIEW